MKKRVLLIGFIMTLGLSSLTACGAKDDPVVRETEMGVQLKDKARDVTGQQEEQAEDADNALDHSNGE